MEEFKKLGLSKSTIEVLKKKGYEKPTMIQSKAIPLLLEGKKDVVGQSQTGTGKTASFALPIIETITEGTKITQAIILAPTRELAMQVASEITSLKGDRKIKVLAVYGGSSIMPQIDKIKRGIDIVVGTPGRVIDLIKRKVLKLNEVQFAVLDEADEMLNMGFVEDIETILSNTPQEKRMLLFSATMPKPILRIAKKYMREYEFIEVEKSQLTLDAVEQVMYEINAKDRFEGLRRILDFNDDFYGIIFANTKATVDSLTQQLMKNNYKAAALHGDITQVQREKILQQFRNKYVQILIATDVAARGIDISDLTHVINFSLPQSAESYVHRIGRTGRAGKKGTSITFVMPSERRKLSYVEKINHCKLIKKELPTGKEIVAKKESEIKDIIKNIIAASGSKSAKFDAMAKELLEDNKHPEKIVSAVLKYTFKKDLELSSYKEMSVVSATHSSSGRGRGEYGGGRSSGGSYKRGGSRGGSRRGPNTSSRSSGRSYEKRSEKKKFSGKRSDSDGRSSGSRDKRSDGRKPYDKKSNSDRSSSRGSDRKPSNDHSSGRGSDRKSDSSRKKNKSPGFKKHRKSD